MIEQHVAVNAAEAPEVLVFQIRAVAVLIHLHGYQVLTFLEIGRDVKLRRLHRPLAIAYALTVHPDVKGRHHALEAQKRLTAVCPTVRHGECAAVLSRRVSLFVGCPCGLRLAHDVWRVNLEGVACRDVDRRSVALSARVDLPVGRHGKRCPACRVKVRAVEVLDALFGRLRPAEQPLAVQAEPAVALLLAVRNEIRPCRFTVDLQHVVVFPVVVRPRQGCCG